MVYNLYRTWQHIFFNCYENVQAGSGLAGPVINWARKTKTLDENNFENFELVLKNIREKLRLQIYDISQLLILFILYIFFFLYICVSLHEKCTAWLYGRPLLYLCSYESPPPPPVYLAKKWTGNLTYSGQAG